MRKKEVDYEINEDLYAVNSVLQMLIQQYDRKIPEDVLDSIERASTLADEHLGKDFIKDADILDMKLVSRVAFNVDTTKDLEKSKKY